MSTIPHPSILKIPLLQRIALFRVKKPKHLLRFASVTATWTECMEYSLEYIIRSNFKNDQVLLAKLLSRQARYGCGALAVPLFEYLLVALYRCLPPSFKALAAGAGPLTADADEQARALAFLRLVMTSPVKTPALSSGHNTSKAEAALAHTLWRYGRDGCRIQHLAAANEDPAILNFLMAHIDVDALALTEFNLNGDKMIDAALKAGNATSARMILERCSSDAARNGMVNLRPPGIPGPLLLAVEILSAGSSLLRGRMRSSVVEAEVVEFVRVALPCQEGGLDKVFGPRYCRPRHPSLHFANIFVAAIRVQCVPLVRLLIAVLEEYDATREGGGPGLRSWSVCGGSGGRSRITPLVAACQMLDGDDRSPQSLVALEMIQMILETRSVSLIAAIATKSALGHSAAHVAAAQGSLAACKLLEKHSAHFTRGDPAVIWSAKNSNGNYPVHCALYHWAVNAHIPAKAAAYHELVKHLVASNPSHLAVMNVFRRQPIVVALLQAPLGACLLVKRHGGEFFGLVGKSLPFVASADGAAPPIPSVGNILTGFRSRGRPHNRSLLHAAVTELSVCRVRDAMLPLVELIVSFPEGAQLAVKPAYSGFFPHHDMAYSLSARWISDADAASVMRRLLGAAAAATGKRIGEVASEIIPPEHQDTGRLHSLEPNRRNLIGICSLHPEANAGIIRFLKSDEVKA